MTTASSARRVFVTGANRGIGFALVRAILEHADDTFVYLGARDPDRGAQARQDLTEQAPEWAERVEVIEIDVADDASVARAAKAIDAHASGARPLYGVVNNAGIGSQAGDPTNILEVNTRGPHRVFAQMSALLDAERGRVVNISSGSAPKFVEACDDAWTDQLISPEVTWAQIEEILERAEAILEGGETLDQHDIGNGSVYGLSKACLNALTIEQAREHPQWTINACTPGFIETGMTRPMAKERGVSPESLGMKPPEEGTRAPMHLLCGEPGGSGWYFGSDAERSPMHRYRSPGDPPYTGE